MGNGALKGKTTMVKINCNFAKFIAWDGSDPLYECRNSASGNMHKGASDATCAACKDRTPVSKNNPPIIAAPEEPKQITLKEYMNATA